MHNGFDDRRAGARISRRRFLVAGAAVTAAATGASLVGCDDVPRPAADGTAPPEPTPSPKREAVRTRGGILRAYNFDAMQYDSLDPHLTQMGPIVNIHHAVYSKVLRYEDERAGTLAPDLAATMPEQPDETTYIIRLRDGPRFHDTDRSRALYGYTAGRVVTADDVKQSIERQMNRNSIQARRFARASNWGVIDEIKVEDAHTLRITTASPVAPFLSFLAGRHAFVIPREVIDREDKLPGDIAMIGSGPFVLESMDGVAVRLRRNEQWFARNDEHSVLGTGRPYLDGYDAYLSPQDDVFQRAAFHHGYVDASGFADAETLEFERHTNLGDIELQERDAGGLIASRLLIDREPFRDDRVRRALHLAVDRTALAALLYPPLAGRPSAKLSGPIAPAAERWAISGDELARHPGYRTDAASVEADRAEARELWDAATGGFKARPELHITIAGVPKALSERAGEALAHQLREVLGAVVTTTTDPSGHILISGGYGYNYVGATAGTMPFTFAVEDGGVDLDDWLYPQFRSGAPLNTYRLQDPQLDAMLEKSRAEFDPEVRRQIGLDMQDYLLANVNARLEFCAPVQRRLVWGYVRNWELPLWDGGDASLAGTWLDQKHEAWTTRRGEGV